MLLDWTHVILTIVFHCNYISPGKKRWLNGCVCVWFCTISEILTFISQHHRTSHDDINMWVSVLSTIMLYQMWNIELLKFNWTTTQIVLNVSQTVYREASTQSKRAFRCSAPAVWNSLLQTLSSDSVAVFKLRLKTFLFSQAFSAH